MKLKIPFRTVIIGFDEDVIDHFSKMILALGMVTLEASFRSTSQSLEYLEENKIDLLFLDFQIFDDDALKFLSALQKSCTPLPSIIFLTDPDSEHVQSILNAGFNYLHKYAVKSEMIDLIVRFSVSGAYCNTCEKINTLLSFTRFYQN